MAHWTERYIGLPYGDGPGAFTCWPFFRHVEREQFGREVPDFEVPGTSLTAAVRAFRAGKDTMGWLPVPGAVVDRKVRRSLCRAGDAVMMAHMAYPSHIGLWVDDVERGSVLHCLKQGSCRHALLALESARWRITDIYRPSSEIA